CISGAASLAALETCWRRSRHSTEPCENTRNLRKVGCGGSQPTVFGVLLVGRVAAVVPLVLDRARAPRAGLEPTSLRLREDNAGCLRTWRSVPPSRRRRAGDASTTAPSRI